MLPLISALIIGMGCGRASAATFVKADVTTLLGPTFFVDDAAPGGSDALVNQPNSGTYVRSLAGLLTANQGTTTVNFTGLGFATSSSASSNDATSVIVAFTYLGADGAAGGGDDVVVGSTTVGFNYISAGEYSCVFDTPLTATLNITATKFQIVVTPSNAGGTGSINFKIGTLAYEGTTGARLSVSGTVSGALPAKAKRLNVAKYQDVIASSENGNYIADYAADGVAGNENSWRSANVTGPHSAEVSLPVTITVRSAHVYLGIDDGSAPASFKVQYFSGGSWVDAPGASVTGNTATEVNVIFSSGVTSSRFRFYAAGNNTHRLKEFALFRPNPDPGTGTELGYPTGTDVELNVAKQRPAVASAVNGTNYAKLAVDGFVHTTSKWQTNTVDTNTLDIDLRLTSKIGSAHLYSGDGSIAPLADFTLQSWNGTAWVDIPGGVITGNTSAARVINFTTPPTTSQVRLTFNNAFTSAVRELCLFPANGGVGYPLGQDVIGSAPPSQKFEDYNNGLYQVINRAASLPMAVNGTAPVLDPGTLDAELSQYQMLLNVGTNTYRLRNRSTGKCLAGAALTTTAGAALADQNYTAMPHQNWRRVSVDGTDFYLVNDWSGLVVDTAAGATAAGTGLVQQVMDGSTTQHWRFAYQTHYPKKGLAGYINRLADIKGDWGYNWGRTNSTGVPSSFVFHPMQWGNFNWNTLEQLVPAWKRDDRAMHVLGFNEPDGADQANLTVEQAITLWPRLERTNMPLVSPVTVNPGNAWMDGFMTQALALGYRMDVVATHKYPTPSSGDPQGFIDELEAGTAVQWSLVADQHGWFFIENPAAAASTRRLRDLTGIYSMVSNTSTSDNAKFRFIVPYAPVEATAPAALTGLTPTAGDAQVALTWTASSSSGISFYRVYRSTTPGGPYTLVSGNLTTNSFTSTALQNGTVYYYTITATDLTGYESVQSTASAATPVIATPPAQGLGLTTAAGGNFTITWPSTHLGWILETQSNGLSGSNWTTVPNTATTTSYSATIPPVTPPTFFRLRRP